MDSTDINRMFPGYDQGETTQRIAAAIFSALNGYKYGIQLASYYVPGDFVPHVRMLKTGYEDVETARLFGMRYVTTYQPRHFDTTLLNYNWQLWNTKAFSVYAGHTDRIDFDSCDETIDAILRMMQRTAIISPRPLRTAYESIVIDEATLLHVKARHAGIFRCLCIDEAFPAEIVEQDLWVKNGQTVNAFNGANDAIGTLVLKFRDAEDMERAVTHQHEWLQVIVD